MAVDFGQSYMSSTATGCAQPETPEVCAIRWRTSMPSLPLAANSGQYLVTGAYTSSSPRSTSSSAASESMVLVVDQTLTMVSRSHWRVRSASAQPPHMSTTNSPSTVTAMDPPSS